MPQFLRNLSSLSARRPRALRTGPTRLSSRLRALFSLNDPRWGRGENDSQDEKEPMRQNQRPQGGPPDLDELWKDFNRRLNGLIGRKEGNGGGNNGNNGDQGNDRGPSGFRPTGRGTGIGAGALLLGAVAVWAASGFFMVQEGQTGVVLEFGRFKYTTGAGINWRMPWPIQSHEVVNLSAVRTIEVGSSTLIKATNQKDSSMLTQDENIVDVRFTVQYNIENAGDFLFFNKTDRNGDQELVAQAAETSVREIVGKNTMNSVLYEGRDQVGIDLAQSIQRILASYKSGIRILSVNVQSVQPPEQVQAAFADVTKAGQDRERAISEGQAYANDIIPRARGTAARLMQEAEGYKARVVSQSEGDASRFRAVQAEYAKAPQVTRDRIYLETMQDVYSNTTKILVDSRQSNNLLYLPLDKLIAQTQGDAPRAVAPAASNEQPAAGTPAQSDLRSREALRNRDRESR
jgi:membrane protease subunit HflK